MSRFTQIAVAALVAASVMSVASTAEARRWFRRGGNCSNGQCYTPAPVYQPVMQSVPTKQAAPVQQTVTVQPTTTYVSGCAGGQCGTTYAPVASRPRYFWRR